MVDQSLIFAQLSAEQREKVLEALKGPHPVPAGTTVLKEGRSIADDEPALLVLERGRLDAFREQRGVDPPGVKVCGFDLAGQALGELAMLYGCPQAATVVAVADSILWSMDRETYTQRVKGAHLDCRLRHRRFLASVPALQPLSEQARADLAGVLQLRRYCKGQVILRQGAQRSEVFLLETGAAAGTVDGHKVLRLGPGQSFGETLQSWQEPRISHIVVESAAATCAVLDLAALASLPAGSAIQALLLAGTRGCGGEIPRVFPSAEDLGLGPHLRRGGLSDAVTAAPRSEDGSWACSAPRCGFWNFGRARACLRCGAGQAAAAGGTSGAFGAVAALRAARAPSPSASCSSSPALGQVGVATSGAFGTVAALRAARAPSPSASSSSSPALRELAAAGGATREAARATAALGAANAPLPSVTSSPLPALRQLTLAEEGEVRFSGVELSGLALEEADARQEAQLGAAAPAACGPTVFVRYPRRLSAAGVVQARSPLAPGECFRVQVCSLGTFGEIGVGLAPDRQCGAGPPGLERPPAGRSMVGCGLNEVGCQGTHGRLFIRGRLPGDQVSPPWKESDVLEVRVTDMGVVSFKMNGDFIAETESYWPAAHAYPTVTLHSGGAAVALDLSQVAPKSPRDMAEAGAPGLQSAAQLLAILQRTVVLGPQDQLSQGQPVLQKPGFFERWLGPWCVCSDMEIRHGGNVVLAQPACSL